MKRLIMKTSELTQFDEFTDEQQIAIHSVFAQWSFPMPGTKVHNGYKLVDAIVVDSFNPEAITTFSLPFTIIGMWQWAGFGDLSELQPLDVGFIDFLPDTQTIDPITMEIVSTTPPILHEPHRWAGWPEIKL